KTVIRICISIVLFLFLEAGCQKKIQPAAGEAPPPSSGVQESRPEDPIQGLAWDTAKAALSGLRSPHMLSLTLRIGSIENEALLPDPPREALLKAFRQDLERAGIEISDTSELLLTGRISKREESLVFAFTISNVKQRESIYSDSASVPMDARLKNTLSQFDHEETRPRKETKIPSPLAELEDAPLDVLPACHSSRCTLPL